MKPTDGETVSQKTLNLVDYGFELFSFTVLKTPSQVFREMSSNATKNKLTTPDVVPTSILFSNARPDKTESQLVAAGEDIRVTILASNLSDKQVNLAFPVRLTVRDAAGQVVQTLDDEIRIQDYLRYGNETDLKKTIQPLEAGTYQVTVEVNPSKSVQEAFFTNNSYTTELEVAKRTMDVSGISLSAEIPDFGKEESVQAKLTYTGENTIRKNNWKAWCSVAYFNNEEETKYWDDFCSTEFGEGGGYGNYNTKKKNDANYEYHALMKEQAVYNHNPKVQFRLRVIKEGEPTAYVYSPIYDLSYRKITCWVDDTKLSRLKGGATGLNPGEEIVVRLKNESTAEGTDPVSGKFFARIMVDENTEINVVPEMEFSLKKGEQSDPIRITKWGKPLYGNQAIDAFLGWDGRDPGYYSALADLEIEEADSTEVTTEQDVVDAYDSLTSFREAVAVAEKTGGTITFRSDIRSQQIMIDRPIEIKGKVSVNGYYTLKKCPLFQAFLTGNPKTKMFVLSEGANLTLKGIGILSMQTRQEPYIENNGGTLTIRQSQFGESSFPEGDGAAIHSTGGKLKIERSRFCSLMANRGGVVFAEGTDTEILNTYFEGNSGGNGACVYATGAPCTIVTSTFLNNNLYGDNSSFGDNIVYGDDQMTIIGSAFGANQGYVEVGGKAKLYGCFLEKAAGTVTADKATVFDDARALFMTDDPSSVLDFTIHDYPAETDDYDVASMIRNIYMARKRKGPYIRRQSDGTIGISTDGKQYTSTDIKAKFAEKSYTVDMFGKARTFQYGCLSTYFSYDDQLILGTAPYKMSAKVKKGKPAETALGRVVAHGIRKATGVSVALIAGGDLKGTIKKGNVTGKKARKVCADPYQIIEIKKLTGDQLKLLLEDSIQRMLRAQKKKKNDRNVLQISGAVVSYKASAKKGKRITGIRINDKKIKASKKYKVAMLSTDKTVKAYSTWARAQTFTMRSSCQEVMCRLFEMSKAKFKKTINKNHYVAVK